MVEYFDKVLSDGDYLEGLDFDETEFVNDMGFVLGGIDSDELLQSHGDPNKYDDYKGETYFKDLGQPSPDDPDRMILPNSVTGFKQELDDGDNTVRHTIASLAFGYEWGDSLGNIMGSARDNGTDSENTYVAVDLGEELDDAFEFGGGVDLDDFPAAFAQDFCNCDALARLKAKLGNKYNFDARRKR